MKDMYYELLKPNESLLSVISNN